MTVLDPADLPGQLAEVGRRGIARFEEALDTEGRERLRRLRSDEHVEGQLNALFGTSDYVAGLAAIRGSEFLGFLEQRPFETPFAAKVLDELVRTFLTPTTTPAELTVGLRRVRGIAQAHIIGRDFLVGDYSETVAATTMLADRLIDFSLERLHEWLVEQMGRPMAADGSAGQRMVVFALGKLGAGELNLSSDVDLVFAYPEAGRLQGSEKTNQAFFLRLGQQLVQVLDNVTGDGFAFRVDMRLRPYGESGALVFSFPALERYYEEQGRGWERYALIRARVCAGDRDAGDRLLATLRPFVYRRYLDFGAIDALRDMRQRVDRERSAAEQKDDVKLGPGGIRDVEFVVQMNQLTWGGRHPELRVARTLDALHRLAGLELLPGAACRALEEGYVFLRDVEHKLQGIDDAQTQRLPTGTRDRDRLAWLMGFADYPDFLSVLDAHRKQVAAVFANMVHGDPDEAADTEWCRLWGANPDAFAEGLEALGMTDPEAGAASLRRLREARDKPSVGREGRARLDALMPRLLECASRGSAPERALGRVVPLLEAVLRRSAYLVLLDENPAALSLLLEISASSRWMAAELARHPALLDDLLDPNELFELPRRDDLARELEERLARCRDPEEAQEALSAFKQSHSFRCAACQLSGHLPLMNISDYLTFLAEVILDAAVRLAWDATAREHGEPQGGERPFIVVGYGKLGGLELGPDSDLDVVFIHGLDPLGAARFLHRMVRRLMQLLTAHTYSGAMYEIDIRLRPDGRSGLLISSLSAFEQYQANDAWVWEQQALVRARPVAGDAELAERFVALRRSLLCRPRDRAELRRAVTDMRRRIEASGQANDLKRGAGGIVDIEFMVQYLVLAWAFDFPDLCEFTDNVRILETAARVGLLTGAQRDLLTEAYLALRAERHRTALDIADDERARDVLARHRDGVRAIWNELLERMPGPGEAPT